MTAHHPAAGADISAAKWRAQRIAEVTAPERIHVELDKAEALIDEMDPADSDLNLARVIVHCTRAVCAALDGRT